MVYNQYNLLETIWLLKVIETIIPVTQETVFLETYPIKFKIRRKPMCQDVDYSTIYDSGKLENVNI